MTFKVGETVVYPHHGAALIEEIIIRELDGEKTEYLVLRVDDGDLTIQVPAINVDLVGVRDVVDEAGVKVVLGVLQELDVEEPPNGSRRFKANQEKIASVDIVRFSEVGRDLYRRDRDKGLSTGEKRMLAKARQILTSEIALAREEDEDAATEFLNGVLDEGIEMVAAKAAKEAEAEEAEKAKKAGPAKKEPAKKAPAKAAPAKAAPTKPAPAKKAPAKKAPAKKAE